MYINCRNIFSQVSIVSAALLTLQVLEVFQLPDLPRFTLKRNKPDNSCPSIARVSEEVMGDDRDEYEFLMQASTVSIQIATFMCNICVMIAKLNNDKWRSILLSKMCLTVYTVYS